MSSRSEAQVFSLYCYPWDLQDEGAAAAIGRFRSWGLSSINLCAAYHRFQAILPHNPRRKTLTADESYVFFDPDWPRYSQSWPRPTLSPEGPGAFREAIAEARRQGLTVRAWTVALHYSPGYRRYPQFWSKNVFDEPYQLSLCPSNPEVQAYLAGMVTDISRTGVDEIELESAHWDRFFNTVHEIHDRIGVRLGAFDHLALSLCFCAACTSRAGARDVDVERLRSFLQEHLANTFRTGAGRAGPEDELVSEFVQRSPELGAYLEVRAQTITNMLEEMKMRSGSRLAVIYYPSHVSGQDVRQVAHVVDRLVLLAYTHNSAEVERLTQAALRRVSDPGMWRVALSLFADHVRSRATIKQHLARLSSLGIREVAFYNYGLAPLEMLDRMRQAIGRASVRGSAAR